MDITSEERHLRDFQKIIHEEIRCRAEERRLADTETQPIYDGIADIPGYIASRPKVMWVLKEAWGDKNSTGKICGGGFEIWDCWGPKGFNTPTWLPMIYILYGIHMGQERVEYRDMPKADIKMVDLLKQSAYININKMPGDKVSGNMRSEYAIWRDIILEQIEAYNPDIIIFGGTFDVMKKDLALLGREPIAKTSTEEIAHFYKDRKGRLLVNSMHPAQRRISWDYYIDEIVENINGNFEN
ncbi:MAG: hypothetical protein K2L11_07740 [Muribaculaceae bacterium]|nr:hypothetical protein [Muribaculaceae bacterium]